MQPMPLLTTAHCTHNVGGFNRKQSIQPHTYGNLYYYVSDLLGDTMNYVSGSLANVD